MGDYGAMVPLGGNADELDVSQTCPHCDKPVAFWNSRRITEAEREIARGQYVTLDELKKSLRRPAPPAVKALFEAVEKACGDLAEHAAHDLDHYGKDHANWYRAVKAARKALAAARKEYSDEQ